ncbi:hypothetical protein [Candidatus Lokiarchaeum ossiferum]|uniref:hypothetical protein n=1 Tax=Candidatus Lokiarchaeum ossiferum TaxID=2951803 RepID=UPI00352F3154
MFLIIPELQNTFIGLIYETFIILLFGVLLILIGWRFKRRKTEYTRNMFIIFLSFTVAIIFSWLSKLILLIMEVPSFDFVDPTTPGFFIIARILQFRVSFILMVVGAYFIYMMKVKIFEEKANPIEKWIVRILSLITFAYSIIFVEQSNVLLDVIAFLFAFLTLMVVFIPFTIASFNMRKSIKGKVYKNAAFSLGIMGICFILILFNFLLDRLWMMIFNDDGYTFFYFAAWAMGILGAITAYIGYIRPEQQQKLIQTMSQNQDDKILEDE